MGKSARDKVKKKTILQDHKREGKKLIPPFLNMTGTFNEVSWVKTILPELLWIAVIQNHHGHRKGVELTTSLARVARQCMPSDNPRIFAAMSEYLNLTDDAKDNIKSRLAACGSLSLIQKALSTLTTLYSECPLQFLFSANPSLSELPPAELDRFKHLVTGLYDRDSRDTMMVQATAVWLAFDSNKVKVQKGLALGKLPEIEKYPHTDLSKEVAASIRCAVLLLVGTEKCVKSSSWPTYFWNQGLRIDPCQFRIAPDG